MPYDFYGNMFGGPDRGTQEPHDDVEDKEFNEFIIRGAKRTHSRIFGALALYSVIAYLLSLILVYALYYLYPKGYYAVFGTMLGTYLVNAVIMYLICLPIFYLMVRKMETRSLWKRKIGAKEFIGILAVSQLLLTVGNYIGVFFNATIGSLVGRNVTNTTAEMIESSPIWMMIVFSVILAPIAEEFLMRKLLIDRLSKYGSGFALVISSVAFGLFHGNFYQFFYATFLGFVLGYLYIRGGLKYSILLHMIVNFMGSVMATLYLDASEKILAVENPEELPVIAALIVMGYALITYGLLIYGAVLLFTKFRRGELSMRSLDDARISMPKGSLGRCVFANAGMIFFIIISALSLIQSIFT